MNGSEMEQFAQAMARSSAESVNGSGRRFARVSVLGGGPDARLLAALCFANGAEVTLFSAYGVELDELRAAGGVTLRGEGPVGTYQVGLEGGAPSIRLIAELDRSMEGAEVVFLTGPVHKQRTYAMALAEHVRDGQVLVVAPGRSLGAIEVAWLLRLGGARADVSVVEIGGLPYWIDVSGASGAVLTLGARGPASAGVLPGGRGELLSALLPFLPNLEPAQSTVHSSFADGSGLVEVPALLLGGPALGQGGPVLPEGAVGLASNATFRNLIGPEQETVMRRLAAERHAVAARFGVWDLPQLPEWLAGSAGAASGAGYRPAPTQAQAQALVRCAVIGSLAPLASAARVAGVPARVTDAVITLASVVSGGDLAVAGRKFETVGVTAETIDDARRRMDQIARGDW